MDLFAYTSLKLSINPKFKDHDSPFLAWQFYLRVARNSLQHFCFGDQCYSSISVDNNNSVSNECLSFVSNML